MYTWASQHVGDYILCNSSLDEGKRHNWVVGGGFDVPYSGQTSVPAGQLCVTAGYRQGAAGYNLGQRKTQLGIPTEKHARTG